MENIARVAGTLYPTEPLDRDRVRHILATVDQLAPDRGHYLHRYLERWPSIILRLRGLRAPAMGSDAEVERLDRLFQGVYLAWSRIRPHTRLNMPNFSYVMLKLFEFVGRPEMALWLHQLKTWSHVYRNERWWQEICVCNNWPAISIFPVPLYERRLYFDAAELATPFACLARPVAQAGRESFRWP